MDSTTSLFSGSKGKKNKKASVMGNGLSRNIFSVRNNNRNSNNVNNEQNGKVNRSNKKDKDKNITDNNNDVIEIV